MSKTELDLQRRLTALGFDPGPIDGKRGPKTTAAIMAFQQKYGLVVDGISGPQTMTALKRAEADPKPARPEPDKSAMAQPVPAVVRGPDIGDPPPNVASLKLLDTARFINEIIAHCTATPEGKDYTVDDIRAWHKLRGFSDIGYHYVIYRDGRVMVGRPIGQIGAHVEGHNTGTIGISYVGGVSADGKMAKDTRTPAQRASLLWLTAQLCSKFPIAKVTGHNQYANKACPSFDVRKDALSRMAA
jgi:N-acetylmuramoyl-L-alanine amidase